MADSMRQQLQQAYQYIKDKKFFEARAILLPLVQQDRENVDAWWMLANAQTDPTASRDALQIVLKLKPDHANAKAMLDRINEKFPPAPPAPAPESDPFADLTDPFSDTAAAPVSPSNPYAPPPGMMVGSSGSSSASSDAPASLDDLLADMGTSAKGTTSPGKATDVRSGSSSYPNFGTPSVGAPMPRYTEKPKRGNNRVLYILLGVFGTLVCGCLACIAVTGASIGSVVNNPTFQAAIGTVGSFMQLPDQLPGTAQSNGFISAGKSVSGSIKSNGYNTYSYNATEGEKITITVSPHSGSDSGILFGLYDKNRKKIAGTGFLDAITTQSAAKTPNPDLFRRLDYTFTSGGTYTILISGIGTRTDYDLSVTSDQ